jgi:hypothetical protein
MALSLNGSTGVSGVDGSAGTPAVQGVDSNTGISFGTDEVSINTGGTTRVKVDSSGRLGVGTTSPVSSLHVQAGGTGVVTAGGDAASDVAIEGASRTYGNGYVANLAVVSNSSAAADAGGGIVFGGKFNGDAQAYYAGLRSGKDNATAGNYSGYLAFATRANGNNLSERMRIASDGTILFAKTQNLDANSGVTVETTGLLKSTRSGGAPFLVNRTTNDGTLVSFLQDGTEEGTISVSGTTVQLNGAHLSRWSQLLDGGREEILRGTVLSNLDEMCDWGEEENEQLNRMKMSEVEGDPNVAGVFVGWDDDDDTYTDDFYCAMTGDFIIRIAHGVPVHKGQLLMSAGDGTAKPQDDDIVRSKTIAKVTSNHVTCTYDDGSYCVPCVLMAC